MASDQSSIVSLIVPDKAPDTRFNNDVYTAEASWRLSLGCSNNGTSIDYGVKADTVSSGNLLSNLPSKISTTASEPLPSDFERFNAALLFGYVVLPVGTV